MLKYYSCRLDTTVLMNGKKNRKFCLPNGLKVVWFIITIAVQSAFPYATTTSFQSIYAFKSIYYVRYFKVHIRLTTRAPSLKWVDKLLLKQTLESVIMICVSKTVI